MGAAVHGQFHASLPNCANLCLERKVGWILNAFYVALLLRSDVLYMVGVQQRNVHGVFTSFGVKQVQELLY